MRRRLTVLVFDDRSPDNDAPGPPHLQHWRGRRPPVALLVRLPGAGRWEGDDRRVTSPAGPPCVCLGPFVRPDRRRAADDEVREEVRVSVAGRGRAGDRRWRRIPMCAGGSSGAASGQPSRPPPAAPPLLALRGRLPAQGAGRIRKLGEPRASGPRRPPARQNRAQLGDRHPAARPAVVSEHELGVRGCSS
jgi:hypothetical protein